MHDYLIAANDAAIYLKETGAGDYYNVKETIPADDAFQPLPRRRATPSSTDLHMARLAIGPINARQGLAPALIASVMRRVPTGLLTDDRRDEVNMI